jgi:hypothetical protein
VEKFFRKFKVVRTPEHGSKGRRSLPPMAKSQENGITIPPGLKDWRAEEGRGMTRGR